jgi:hypothetical protein
MLTRKPIRIGIALILTAMLFSWFIMPFAGVALGRYPNDIDYITGRFTAGPWNGLTGRFTAPLLVLVILYVQQKRSKLSRNFTNLAIGYIALAAIFEMVAELPFLLVDHNSYSPKWNYIYGPYSLTTDIISFLCLGYLGYLVGKNRLIENQPVIDIILKSIIYLLLIFMLFVKIFHLLFYSLCLITGDCL